MLIKLDASKDKDGNHVLHLVIDGLSKGSPKWAIPIGCDVLYALYKGINLEVKHFELALTAEGEAALKAAEEQASGSEEQAKDAEGSPAAAAEGEVHPQ